jgi:hypothetical protein
MNDLPDLPAQASEHVEDLLAAVRAGFEAERQLIELAGSAGEVRAWLQDSRAIPRSPDADNLLQERVTRHLAELKTRKERFLDNTGFWQWFRREVRREGDAERKANRRREIRIQEYADAKPKPPSQPVVPFGSTRSILQSEEMKEYEACFVGPDIRKSEKESFKMLCDTLFRVRLWRALAHHDPRKNHVSGLTLARLVFGPRRVEEKPGLAAKIDDWLRPYKERLDRVLSERDHERKMLHDSKREACEPPDG